MPITTASAALGAHKTPTVPPTALEQYLNNCVAGLTFGTALLHAKGIEQYSVWFNPAPFGVSASANQASLTVAAAQPVRGKFEEMRWLLRTHDVRIRTVNGVITAEVLAPAAPTSATPPDRRYHSPNPLAKAMASTSLPGNVGPAATPLLDPVQVGMAVVRALAGKVGLQMLVATAEECKLLAKHQPWHAMKNIESYVWFSRGVNLGPG